MSQSGSIITGGSGGSELTIHADSGTATSVSHNINVFGAGGTTTSASGSTVTITSSTSSPSVLFGAHADAQSNVTGDGTVYTVLFANEDFDVGNNFSASTFTAPSTGKYLLNLILSTSDANNQTFAGTTTIVTNSASYTG